MPRPPAKAPAANFAEFGARMRRFRETRHLDVDQLGQMLNVSGSYVYTMERGIHAPCDRVRAEFDRLAFASDVFSVSVEIIPPLRDLPIVSWAQAGRATLYEELPESWQEVRACRCPDQQAFLLTLTGDSAEPRYHAGDHAVVMPNHVPKSPCLVVAKLIDDGYCFKRFTENKTRPHRFRLSSYNRAYPSREYTWAEVDWVFPVYCVLESGR